jgi:hypothetical protein
MKETLEEAAEINLTNLCYYDKRNPDCSVDDEDIEAYKKSLLKKNKTCSCDNCFYGRTELTEQLIWQAERMYSKEEIKEAYWNRTDDIDVDGYWISDPEKDLEELLKEMKKIPMTFIPDERMYSEEEVYSLLCSIPNFYNMTIPQQVEARDKWFEQFKKK